MMIEECVGVPWVDGGRTRAGWDCWGLVRYVYRTTWDLELMGYEDRSYRRPEEAALAVEAESMQWVEVEPGSERRGDVVVFSPCHVGLVLRRGLMVHCLEQCGTVVQRYNVNPWKHKVMGIYRHERLAG